MRSGLPLPSRIAAIAVPQDDVSAATWRWAQRSLPDYLLAHSVRAFCWGAALADGEGWTYDAQLLSTAALCQSARLLNGTDLAGWMARSP